MKNKFIITLTMLALAPFAAVAQDSEMQNDSAASATPQTNVPADTATATSDTSTPAGWTDDFSAAKKQAQDEGKDLFVVFSGSDWCGWCMRLEEDIFSKDGFVEEISETFVPVFIDMPNNKSLLSKKARKQNPMLAAQYGVDSFPTVLLMDSDGDVFAVSGYMQGGPDKYLDSVKKMTETGKNSPEYKAKKALEKVPQGQDRVQQLDAILAPLPTDAQIENVVYVDEVLAADPDGSLGYRAKYPFFTVVRPIKKDFSDLMHKMHKDLHKEFKKLKNDIKKHEKKHDKAQEQKMQNEILQKVVAENIATLTAVRQAAQEAQTQFQAETRATKELNDILKQIDFLLSRYSADDASATPAPQN